MAQGGRGAGGGDDDATQVDDALALAETRVLEDGDKTQPPPIVTAAPGEPAATGASAAASANASPPDALRASPPRPTPSPAQREGSRGLEPGTILFGEYEIVDVLGVGGMGEVYRARHRRLDEHRAIKVMHAELSKRRGASEFFYREAKALLAVRHPAVVHCHDLLSDDAGRVYLIMEMIEGIPLSRKLAAGPLSADDVAILGARVAHGLAAAHRKGVIHRDLSPDNIVLPNGRVQEAKIIDFGIAKLLEQGEGTIVDGFKGKLSYASPEQLGFFGGKLDGRSDLYSLGLVLVAAALGRPMPMGTTVMEAVDARRSFGKLPDGVPIGLRSAIQPLLALDPNDRPQFVDRLFVVPGAFDSTDPGLHPLPSPKHDARDSRPDRRRESPKKRTTLTAGVVGAVVLTAAGGAWLALGSGSTDGAQGSASTTTASTARSATSPGATALEATQENASAAGVVAPSVADASAAGATSALAAEAAARTEASGPSATGKASTAPTAPTAAKASKPAVVASSKAAPTPSKRGLSATDRLRIVGMLTNAKLALGEGRLMSPAGDNAYDRYRSVLRLEPGNAAAKSGLRDIAGRYVKQANASLEQGDEAAAAESLRHARQADPTHPGIRVAEAKLKSS